MKKLLCATLALLLMLALGAAARAEEENLLENGDFSRGSDDLPDGWRREMWLTDIGVSLLTVDPDGYDGDCVTVTNVDANDARFAQTVKVEPDTVYRLSGMVRAEGCGGENGASLSVADVFVYTDALYDTQGQWQYAELYGRTGPKQTELTVYARVGGYGDLAKGRASFDDVRLVKVDVAPAGVTVNDLFREQTESAASESDSDDAPPRNTETWLLFTCCWALLAVGVARKRDRAISPMNLARLHWLFFGLLALAFVLRLAVSTRVRGYNTDISCFTAWSERMFSEGPTRFYAPDYFCDYPPGYMLLLWPIAALRRLFALDTASPSYLALLKLLPMLSDIAAAVLVWRVCRKRLSESGAVLLGLMIAFNPAVIADSAAWGQIDSLLALAIALCALEAIEGRNVRALLWFGAAMLIKPQALLFGPVGLVALLCGAFAAEPAQRKARLRGLLIGAAACLGMLYAVGLICCAGSADSFGQALVRPISWLVELYSGTMGGYKYLTVNTLNLYCLLGLNWAQAEAHTGAMALAWALFALSYLGCIALLIRSAKAPGRLLLIGGLMIVLVCAFGPMIHERYLYPAVLLLTLAYGMDRDRRLLISLVILSCTLFLNEVLVLQGGMTQANYGHLQSNEDWLNHSLCILNLLNAAFLAWTAADICLRERIWAPAELPRESLPAGAYTLAQESNYTMGIRRPDLLLMAAVTALYSVLAFTNLGATKAPQSGWTSSQSGEAVVFDLGETQTFRMTYYGGICNSAFTVELSNDGAAWTEPCWARYAQGEIFRWLWYTPLDENLNVIYGETVPTDDGAAYITYARSGDSDPMQTARYVRITAQSAGLVLYETAFLDADGGVLPVAVVAQSGQTENGTDAHALIDEQGTVPPYPSYLNSTYFDEIYHARTAFEHLQGMKPYEYTHPPLGKVLMMVGIQLFGMTPFGWRFMGALVGVMMVPLMYLLAKQLTKDTRLSFIAMCLMALDSMHFTQTRIATIDSYAVFWIMLMYLFMFRYCQMNWNREPLRKTLVPLGLCGVTMGLAWATKWIGLYASAGLAILFFWTVFRRLREMKYVRDRQRAKRSLVITLLFCLVFFIAIPAIIYYFSYYWFMRGEGLRSFGEMFSAKWVKFVVDQQKSIFSYHAGLGGDTHYFRSPWYQWPIIWWPMWYYSGTGYMPEGMISSISCMGNPAVWWFGLAALLFCVGRLCWRRRAHRADLMVVIGFASQFLPWVIVPRSTFIYHYFASVPFIILASALLLDAIRKRSETAFNATAGALLGTSLILFGAFYPLESGLPCARNYARYLRWFKWYNY